ncbi:MAG: glycosyltransferase, partial [Chloroflexi bacterium]|nr:glycosyltransferase [Chloroflexota bacterium]
MNVLMISKACVVGAYQRKLEEIAASGVELSVVVPPEWRDPTGTRALERKHTRGYRLLVTPMRFNGHFHAHYYPRLPSILRETKPQVVHVDEEPWDLVTFHAVHHAVRVGARPLFFTWQNLRRHYPPPFNLFQQFTFRHCAHAIAGNRDAVQVLRAKGYRGELHVIPQFGVDPEIFKPPPNLPRSAGEETTLPPLSRTSTGEGRGGGIFTIGFAGRFTREKGIDTLLHAVAQLGDVDWQLRLAGSGPELANWRQLARKLDIDER